MERIKQELWGSSHPPVEMGIHKLMLCNLALQCSVLRAQTASQNIARYTLQDSINSANESDEAEETDPDEMELEEDPDETELEETDPNETELEVTDPDETELEEDSDKTELEETSLRRQDRMTDRIC